MAPLKPHWTQPSHPDVQEVIKASDTEFLTKSVSKVTLPPFAVFAKMSFPPCSFVEEPTYATVQCGRDKHFNLNSDLLYINHSCDPSLIFDTGNFNVLVGPKGLKPGDELTFFYPSTEWSMAQPFDCFCGAPSCRGTISGARDMTKAQLEGVWLNGHVLELLAERDAAPISAPPTTCEDATAQALRHALEHAEKAAEAALSALRSYTETLQIGSSAVAAKVNGTTYTNDSNGINGKAKLNLAVNGTGEFGATAARRGPTSRELSGEMGGDTKSDVSSVV
ncbi:hypothetical protein SODALDRAFT_305473 [Sodiomyces alkalinus F11]|uniref:Post-SET domain-containing protein n=1 Tax=Sodiomyces alkalinus (strain CBS 110278 / VKM F-3762 / F11) TaxID=1314773 RepID=A0A3N2Q9P3_SODAK|nr:hypothetical protein SODALDRAFT_305473 [Sodiomyces alkalinus F11]ROT43427.1 hypothetical protein SODALDRAFT_305473 [Sodiomyces alkalinus F11]